MAKYFCRVEYLESTGEQWINTGVNVDTSTDEIKLYFQLIDTSLYKWFFGEYDTNARIGLGSGDGTDKRNFLYQQSATKVSDAQMYNKQHLFEINSNGGFLDGTKIRDYVNFASTSSIYLFNLNIDSASDYRCKSKIWKYEHKRNGVLIKELVPCLDNNGKPSFYDNVSGQLFYNQGSGEFNVGRQIHPVEYLESTGTQYIDTGVVGDLTTEINCEASIVEAGNASVTNIMGNNVTSSRAITINMSANITNPSPSRIRFGNTDNTTVAGAINLNTFYKYNTNKDKLTVKDTNNTVLNTYEFNATTTFTTNGNILIYKLGDTSTQYIGKIKVKSASIINNGTIVRDFIPCIDENNVPFMFDLVTNTIYNNAGTGQFKVGKYLEQFGANKKLLRKKYDMMLSSCFKKKPYYCEVEYLESTGTQYIDTGIAGSTTLKIEMSGQKSGAGYGVYFGAGTGNNRIQAIYVSDYNSARIGDIAVSQLGQDTEKFNIVVDTLNKNVVYNGTTYPFAYTASLTNLNIFMFTRNEGSSFADKATAKCWFFKVWDNDTLVRDMIPVLDWSGLPCMYDKISGQLFYNQGTGTFQYGRQIHYVEYLETTSQASTSTTKPWINTLVNYWADFEIGVKLRESASNVCLSCGGGSYRLERINATNPYWRFQGGGGSYNYDSTIPITEYHVLKWKDGKISCDGEVLVERDHLLNSGTYTALFTNSTSSGNTIYPNVVYFLKMWNPTDGTLVRDYLPAIDENGVGFMFDRVTHTIFDNAGTGSFKYPAREVEYLQSDGARAIVAGVTVDDTCGYDVKWMALNANDTIILGTKGAGDSRWVLSGNNNPNVNLSWNTSYGSTGLGLNKIQTAQMNYLNDRKRVLNGTPLADITTTLSANASTYNVGIFGGYWGANTISLYSTCRIYYAKITKGTELICDFIPMIKDGSPCLFDKIGGLYHFGTGTGTFTTGKIKEKEWEEV